MEYASTVRDPYQIIFILIVLKESNVEWQDGLDQITADLVAYLTYCNLLNGQH